jgi:hypothetical protein
MLDATRSITDALTNLIVGPLAGLFDAPTNFDLAWDAPVQSMDLSGLRSRGDPAIAVACPHRRHTEPPPTRGASSPGHHQVRAGLAAG